MYKPNHILNKSEANCHQSLIKPREESFELICVFFSITNGTKIVY